MVYTSNIAEGCSRAIRQAAHLHEPIAFTEQWRASVNPEDLPFFLTARRARHVLLLVLLLETHFLAFNAYARTVVDLWRCMNAGLR